MLNKKKEIITWIRSISEEMRERHGPIQVSTYLNMELNLLPIRNGRPGNEINSLPLTDGRTDSRPLIMSTRPFQTQFNSRELTTIWSLHILWTNGHKMPPYVVVYGRRSHVLRVLCVLWVTNLMTSKWPNN